MERVAGIVHNSYYTDFIYLKISFDIYYKISYFDSYNVALNISDL